MPIQDPVIQENVKPENPANPEKSYKTEVTPVVKEESVSAQDNGKVAYLTFDDGPSKYTAPLLDILKQHEVKASFFWIGSNLEQHQDVMKRLLEEKHYAGLHSMTHNYKKLYESGGSKNFVEEFQAEQKLVENMIGVTPWLIRAPYGSSPQMGEAFRGDVAAAGFKMWDWTIDSLDWNLPGQPDKIIEQISGKLSRQKEVILLHEREQTIAALPGIIKLLKDSGYKIEAYDPNKHSVVNFKDDQRL